MSGLLVSLQGAVAQGVLWGIMVLGVYITFRLMDIADMTVDGSFALGACVCAVLVVNKGVNPVLALLVAAAAGVVAGAVTGILHTVFEIPAILAGILTQISLWSINLRIMGGKSNLPLLKVKTLISGLAASFGMTQAQASMIVGIVLAVAAILFLYWFFGTEIGSAMRATGNNEDMVRALGVDTRMTKLLSLMVSNGLVGLSGALVCQSQKYGDVGSGTGAIVIGLAAIVIGEVLMGRLTSFYWKLTSVVVGSVIYFVIRAVVLRMGMDANDMKLLSAVIVALALCIPVALAKYRLRKDYKRAKYIGRVFQDPMRGTAANMEIQENLAMALRRGKSRGLGWGIKKNEKDFYREALAQLDLGLQTRMTSKVGLLSGGQRQALTLLMATLQKPKLLLLDEHTAALDPKTARKVLDLTEKIVDEQNLTALMVTHNMKDAIQIGNRLIMMHEGRIIYDVAGEEKKNLQVEDLLERFEKVSGEEFANDRMMLAK